MKNYKILMNEVKEVVNKPGNISCPWMGKFNMAKMTVFPTIYKFNVVPTKNTETIFLKISTHLKSLWKSKELGIANTTLKGKNKVGKFTLPDFKSYYKATAITTLVSENTCPNFNGTFSINQQSHISPQSTVSPPGPLKPACHFSILLFLSLDHFKCPAFQFP